MHSFSMTNEVGRNRSIQVIFIGSLEIFISVISLIFILHKHVLWPVIFYLGEEAYTQCCNAVI